MGKAPSSLRCVAAPISSGPSVRTIAFGGSPAGGASPSTQSRPLAPDHSDVRSPTDSSDPYSGYCICRLTSAVPLSPVPANIRPRPRAVKGLRDLGNFHLMHVSRARFEELVADALDSIPPDLAVHMDNVVVLVEDWPTREQLGGRRGTLLGLYEGVQLTNRSPLNYAGVMPDRVTIFRGPLCERSQDEAHLAHQIRVTVVHEIGHHFGIDDARLHELGY